MCCVTEYFNDKDIDVIYSSDLVRAYDTVKGVAENKNLEIVPIEFDGIEELPLLPVKEKGTICVAPTELYEGFFVAKIKKK